MDVEGPGPSSADRSGVTRKRGRDETTAPTAEPKAKRRRRKKSDAEVMGRAAVREFITALEAYNEATQALLIADAKLATGLRAFMVGRIAQGDLLPQYVQMLADTWALRKVAEAMAPAWRGRAEDNAGLGLAQVFTEVARNANAELSGLVGDILSGAQVDISVSRAQREAGTDYAVKHQQYTHADEAADAARLRARVDIGVDETVEALYDPPFDAADAAFRRAMDAIAGELETHRTAMEMTQSALTDLLPPGRGDRH